MVENIVVFTGAGASRPLGYPTTTEFFAKDLVSEVAENPVQKDVLRKAASYLNLKAPHVDVEAILQLLDPFERFFNEKSGQFMLKHLSPSQDIKAVIPLLHNIRRRVFNIYSKPPDEAEVKNLYKPLFDLLDVKNNRILLFTTNYDPVPDVLIKHYNNEGITVWDGFNGFGEWDPSGYQEKSGLYVYRLHGCLSWVRDSNTIKNTHIYKLIENRLDYHLVLYPGYKGNPLKEDEPFSYSHKILSETLRKVRLIVVIGFSFRDDAINNAFKEAIKTNVFYITPKLEEIKSLKEILGTRVVHPSEPSKFEDRTWLQHLKNLINSI